MTGALAGIKILDLSRLLPGPYCTMILADHGAEVIAVEDRKFMADGLYFRDLYRNKRHISLNLKTAAGLIVFEQLARQADVIVEGFRPGVVQRLGIDYDRVRKINPGIIYCAITGYGQTGSMRDRVGHDVNYLATAGLLDLIGEANRPPVIPAVQIADIAGGMNAVMGILMALLARSRNGEGQYIDISMTDSLLGFMTLPLLLMQLSGDKPRRSAHLLSHKYACYCTYETADGRYIALGALEKRFWAQLCTHLALPEWIDLQFDETRREEIIERLRTIFRQKSRDDWDRQLSQLDVCHAVVRDIDEVLTGPLFAERDMIVSQPGLAGTATKAFASAIKLSLNPATVRSQPVGFGENTWDVLRELGYADGVIAEFAEQGVI